MSPKSINVLAGSIKVSFQSIKDSEIDKTYAAEIVKA